MNMNNSNQSLSENDQGNTTNTAKASWGLIAFILLVIIVIGVAWQFTGSNTDIAKTQEPIIQPAVSVEPTPEKILAPAPVETEEITAVIPPAATSQIEELSVAQENPLPLLDESDNWLKLKLPEITWRKELLQLIIDEDMIRRFVVFTDNFAQGNLAYDHSPFVLPKGKFFPDKSSTSFEQTSQSTEGATIKQNVWQWSERSSERFSLYIELLRSMDSDSLVQWYTEVKPLIDEAYSELGYDDDFTQVLQDAITRVLDMEVPKSPMKLIQPSVVYKFADPQLEALPATEKLLLRLGKDNLLVMKSVLLELHEKLAQQANGISEG